MLLPSFSCFPDIFRIFGYGLHFFKWGVATPIVNAFFVGNGLNCLEKMGQFYTENLGAWQSCEKRDLSRMVSEILCPF